MAQNKLNTSCGVGFLYVVPETIGVLSQSFNCWLPCPERVNMAFLSAYNTYDIVKFEWVSVEKYRLY